MSAAGPCNYTFLRVKKPEDASKNPGVEVETRGKILGLDYYESVYSPMVTILFVKYGYFKFFKYRYYTNIYSNNYC